MTSRLVVNAFTDGACKKNPGIGGWGWVAYTNRKQWRVPIQWSNWGGKKMTTNQQMELRAMIGFLDFCPRGCKVEVWSDSMYVLGGIVGSVPKEPNSIQSSLVCVNSNPQGWINGWKTSSSKLGTDYFDGYWSKKDLKNPVEWYRLHQLLLIHVEEGTDLNFGWVKGHAAIEGNEIADTLANMYPLRNLRGSK